MDPLLAAAGWGVVAHSLLAEAEVAKGRAFVVKPVIVEIKQRDNPAHGHPATDDSKEQEGTSPVKARPRQKWLPGRKHSPDGRQAAKTRSERSACRWPDNDRWVRRRARQGMMD